MQEALSYGTHVVLDGFRAEPEALADVAAAHAVLEALGRILEPDTVARIQVFEFPDGVSPGASGAALLSESNLALHLFPDAHKLTLRVFSRHGVSLGEVAAVLESRYRMGRFETQLRNRSHPAPREETLLQRALHGERTYARLRLEDLLRDNP